MVPFALFGAAFYAVYAACNKYVYRSGLGAVPAAILVVSTCGLLAAPLLLCCDTHWVPATAWHALFLCAVSSPAMFLATYSYSREDASVVGPVISVKIVALPFVEAFLFGKSLSAGVWAGAGLAAAGIVFVSQTDRWTLKPSHLLRPGVLMMATAALVFAVGDVVCGDAIPHWPSSWQFTVHITFLQGLVGLALLGGLRLAGWTSRKAFRVDAPAMRRAALPLAAGGTALLVAQLCLFQSMGLGGNVTLTNILYSTRSLMVVGLMAALVFLGHSRVEHAGWRAYTFRAAGAALLATAILVALQC
ncbi:MAG: EamA family transporter [Candidatus Coatesbacteria bacterium]